MTQWGEAADDRAGSAASDTHLPLFVVPEPLRRAEPIDDVKTGAQCLGAHCAHRMSRPSEPDQGDTRPTPLLATWDGQTPMTATGVVESVVVPLPSWPWSF